MKLTALHQIQRVIRATVSSVLTFVLVFQVAFASFSSSANAANLPDPVLLATNGSTMANQVQGQLDLERDRLDRRNSQRANERPRPEQKVDRKVSSERLDLVEPTVEDPTKGAIDGMADVEKPAKLAGVKAVEKVGAAVGNDNRGFANRK